MSFLKSKHSGWTWDLKRTPFGGGPSGNSSAAPTQTTVQNTNIPAYAQPYVETMLGAAQQQIFNYDGDGNVTSMKPYTPYSNNATDYIAGFSPLQQQAQSNIANMGTPEAYGTATDFGTTSGLGAMGTANPAMQYGGLGATYGGLGAQAGLGYGQNATNAQSVGQYMNPYLQNVLNPAMQLQQQQFGQIGAQNQSQATAQGAFGGGRQAVMQGLNQQNQMLAQNQLVGQGYSNAYDTAQKNMQAAASLGMQGTAQGMQGAGLGLQGVQGAQAAYQQLGAQGANLANIANQQTQSQLGINAAQQASGAAQQAQQQNVINQQIQNYATEQQYPMMQLSNMSGLLRGLPMQAATTQTYQAAPSAVSTLGGLGATALGAYGAAGGFKGAKGGLPKDFEKVKNFTVGGSVESSLSNMPDAQLVKEAKSNPSPMIREMAAELLAARESGNAVSKSLGVTPSATATLAGGGIVAFEDGGDVEEKVKPEDKFGYRVGKGVEALRKQGFGQPSEIQKELAAEIKTSKEDAKAAREQNLWLALMGGGAKAMASKSPFGNVGVGEGAEATAAGVINANKTHGEALKDLQATRLGLAKQESTDQGNLLHYGVTGATSQMNAEETAAARVEAAKQRRQQASDSAAGRQNDKWMSLYGTIYNTNVKAAQDKLTGRALTEQEKTAIAQQSMSQVDLLLKSGGKKGLNIAAAPVGGNAIRFDEKGNQIQG